MKQYPKDARRIASRTVAGLAAVLLASCGVADDEAIAPEAVTTTGQPVTLGDIFSAVNGTLNSWNDFFSGVNNSNACTSGCFAIEQQLGDDGLRDGSVTMYFKDYNGNGTIDRDEGDDIYYSVENPDGSSEKWSKPTRQGVIGLTPRSDGSDSVSVVQRGYFGYFHNSAPDPIRSATDARLSPNDQDKVFDLTQRWVTSGLADKFSAYGYRRIKAVRLVGASSPSFYTKSSNTVYISMKDYSEFGAVALDHELMIAGLHHAFKNGLIGRFRYLTLMAMNVRRYDHLDGYVGTLRHRFDRFQVGAAKAFLVGQQYAKIQSLLRANKLGKQTVAHAKKFIDEVNGNVLVSHTAPVYGSKPIRMIDTNANKSKIDAFLSDFTSANTRTRNEIDYVAARLPAVRPAELQPTNSCGGAGDISASDALDCDPGCEFGLKSSDGKACCPATCGTCGGSNCDRRPGGSDACCSGEILKDKKMCSSFVAPCTL